MALPTMSGVGRLTADPEVRYSQSGKAVTTVNVAFNDRKKDGDQWVDGDSFFLRGTIFGPDGEEVAQRLTKGQEVTVTARLKTRKYENRDGQQVTVTEGLVQHVAPIIRAPRQQQAQPVTSGQPQSDPWAQQSPPPSEVPF